ncbi:MAG: tRNA glutamyl-Q(34) synthetase GluQRS [Phycisphaeraceae bacterium]|nr:MAG: tRNA glutamyl-Q(34) synthetase GluQRS [Phycisphaeraceae bacterium]
MRPPVTPNPDSIGEAVEKLPGPHTETPVPGAPELRITRLAPSPTGALHLGNARTFLITWAMARRNGWRVILRIEDLDGPRIKPDAAAGAIRDLAWLGLDWDGEVLVQSADLSPYRAALERLATGGHTFSCDLSRTDIEQAGSAPHAGDHEQPYPRNLRPPHEDSARWRVDRLDTNYRFAVPDGPVTVHDEFAGDSVHHPSRQVGDFVIWTKRATPAYQLAVVVDDARQGVTDVIRGDDLLPSAARQQLLYEALGLPAPRWWHLPLVVGRDGRRLAKRHGDTRVAFYREQGVPPERIIALLARWSGVGGASVRREAPTCRDGVVDTMSALDFARAFDPARLSRSPVTFTGADHAWLLSGMSRSSWSSPPSHGS